MVKKKFLIFSVSLACVLALVLVSCPAGSVVTPDAVDGYPTEANAYNVDHGKGTVGGIRFELKYIAAGTTHWGSPLPLTSEGLTGETDPAINKPLKINPHNGPLDAFRIGTTEVTQEMWKAVMGTEPGAASQKGDKSPVDTISFNQIAAFCNELTIKTGRGEAECVYYNTSDTRYTIADIGTNPIWKRSKKGFRVPTVGEWEKAAGNNGAQRYAGTNDKTKLANYAWIIPVSTGRTHAVATKAPNTNGLYDMNGNLWEYCWDWVDESAAFPNNTSANDTPPSGMTKRIIKGGCCGNSVAHCSVADRRWGQAPATPNYQIGFRIACNY